MLVSLSHQTLRRYFFGVLHQLTVNIRIKPSTNKFSKRLMGMYRSMGLHFDAWVDYNGVAFSIALLEWGRTFSDFLG